MKKIFLSLLSLLLADAVLAQGGCSDAGVCTLGGHSSQTTDGATRVSAHFQQTFSANSDYTYFESTPSLGYDFDFMRAELSVNWRYAQSLVIETAAQVSRIIESGDKLPRVQHVAPHSGDVNSSYAFGDAMLSLTFPMEVVATGVKLHLAGSLPLTKLYENREQDLQSTLGLPSLIAGLSYDASGNDWTYGSTLAYQTTFGQQNDLHLIRADDLAIALRARRAWGWLHSMGFDMSAIYHLKDDRLHGTPTREISGNEPTSGITVNLGASAVKALDENIFLGLFAAAPVMGIAHVDGLKRSFVIGLSLAYR